jgi:hypothetical protein
MEELIVITPYINELVKIIKNDTINKEFAENYQSFLEENLSNNIPPSVNTKEIDIKNQSNVEIKQENILIDKENVQKKLKGMYQDNDFNPFETN